MAKAPIARDPSGCYHPTSEDELIALVAHAYANDKKLRVIGSSHSVWRAIVTDNYAGCATPDDEMLVVLDGYIQVFEPKADPSDPERRLVEVQAGCHLGGAPKRLTQGRIEQDDEVAGPATTDVGGPAPWHDNDWETSLTSILHKQYELALPDLGGITHQTVSGFLSTGSAGGTTRWSVHEAIAQIRIIDGTGKVTELSIDGSDPSWFRAAGIAMGLCGVISTVTFRCIPAFDIIGTETISEAHQCDVLDFYADRPGAGLPTLERFLLDTDYTRLMWWPQYNFDRLVVWQAARAPYERNRKLKPYQEVASFSVLSQMAASVIYTIIGNIDDPERAIAQLENVRHHPSFEDQRARLRLRLHAIGDEPTDLPAPNDDGVSSWLEGLHLRLTSDPSRDPVTDLAPWVPFIDLLVTGADYLIAAILKLPIIKPLFGLLAKLLPDHIDTLLGIFVTTGEGGAPATQRFEDRGYMGLPMDNQMDDLLMPTWFTELWIPFTEGDGKVELTISTLRKLFDADGTAKGAYEATGAFSFELYAGKAEPTFYLSPATGTQNVFRVDVFWFGRNAAEPQPFFRKFWDALAPLGFRLHWGKFLEEPAAPEKLDERFPQIAEWKEVRERTDPKNVFLTEYWSRHLGL